MIGAVEMGAVLGLVAFVYADVLMQDGHILFWWWDLIEGSKLPEWIKKPMATCGTCVSGQAGLWGYLIMTTSPTIFELILCTCTAIASRLVLSKYIL